MMEEESPREACGLFGIYNHKRAAHLTYRGLFALQHRGQESAGIVTSDHTTLKEHRGLGLVSEVFSLATIENLSNPIAIGHVRYSTTGSTTFQNIQPLLVTHWRGQLAVAHNGNLVNAKELRTRFERAGSIFQTTTDSEIIVHLVARSDFAENRDAILAAMRHIRGAFCLLMLTPRELVAVRDPHGIRPLSLGMLDGAYVVASETCAFDLVGAKFIRDIRPGEVLFIDDWGLDSRTFVNQGDSQSLARCIFEFIYFARPDSVLCSESVHEFRKRLGRQLAKEHPADADVVVPVPDSGNSAALGYSLGSGIPLDYGFIRNHYVGRTFIDPGVEVRGSKVSLKLNTVSEIINGKRVVVVDDSIVRGVTTKEKIHQLIDVGAAEIHMRVSCPPIRHPCFYGIDFPSPSELIASGKEIEQIRKELGLTSLGYLSLEGMLQCVTGDPAHYCTACFTGEYPLKIPGGLTKQILEVADYSD